MWKHFLVLKNKSYLCNTGCCQKERELIWSSNVQADGSEASGKSPTESKDGQAEEGAESGVERLNLGRGPGSPAPPVGGAVGFIAHGDIAPTWESGKHKDGVIREVWWEVCVSMQLVSIQTWWHSAGLFSHPGPDKQQRSCFWCHWLALCPPLPLSDSAAEEKKWKKKSWTFWKSFCLRWEIQRCCKFAKYMLGNRQEAAGLWGGRGSWRGSLTWLKPFLLLLFCLFRTSVMVSCRHSVFESKWDCCETNEESLDPF